VTDYASARAADHARYGRLFHAVLERGVYFPPSGYEALFPSLAHSDADIERTLAVLAESRGEYA
jgi:glutamate-1-semialdehyde 2,1-aminomutase